MSRKIYKSAMGKTVDLGALLLQNEQVRAVGNMGVNAAGDRIDSAVVPLPEDRRKVTLGRLTVKSVAADGAGDCLAITYVPTVLPKDVEASSDPLLFARAAPYAIGLGRRSGEGNKQ